MSFHYINSHSRLMLVTSISMGVCPSSNSNASTANNQPNSNNRRSSLNRFSRWDRGHCRRTQEVDSFTTDSSKSCKTYWCKLIALSSSSGRCRARACRLQLPKLCVNNSKSTLEMPRHLMRATTYFRIEVVSSHRHGWQDNQANSKMLSNSKWTTYHSQALRTSRIVVHRLPSNISSSLPIVLGSNQRHRCAQAISQWCSLLSSIILNSIIHVSNINSKHPASLNHLSNHSTLRDRPAQICHLKAQTEELPEMVALSSTSNSSESNMIIYTKSQLWEQKWLSHYKYEI